MSKAVQTNPVKVIRQYCLDCSNGSPHEVRKCHINDCPLYPFRFGKNPYRKKRVLSEERKEVLRQRLASIGGKNAGVRG